MLLRVIRAISAACTMPSESAGMNRWSAQPLRDRESGTYSLMGNQRSATPNR